MLGSINFEPWYQLVKSLDKNKGMSPKAYGIYLSMKSKKKKSK